MKQIPEFLQNLYNDTEKETRPFSRIFAFINLSEAVIKFYTVVTVQNFLETEEGNPSLEEGKAVLGKGLARPSLGLWAFFTERITGLIPKDKFFWENFPEFFEKDLKPATAILVNLRNKYHHGAVPSNEECSKDLSIAELYLRKILFEGLIGEDRIIIGDVIQGAKAKQVFLERADGRRIELSPLLHSELSPKSKKEELYYFNDAKKWDKGTINTMSYDVGEHVSNKEIFNEFRKSFPIPDWEKTKVSRFANRIAELTENFQGRTTELSKIKTFLTESNQGFFFIWGGPGIGKSALIARSLVLVRAGLEEKTQVGETGFDLGTKDIIVLEYFIRRATITEKEDTFYSMLGEDLEGIFKTGISMGNNLQEKKEKWRARLEKIQRKLNGSENIGEDEDSEEDEKPKPASKKKTSEYSFVGKKLILCIDGLDEGEEGILRSIPRGSDLYSNILFVLGGRDVTQTRTLFTTLDADKKAEIILHGLSETDIRAIMLKVGNSDNLPSEYIAKLLKVSEGNPLYLKMISDSIERGERQAGDLDNLPAGVDNLYDGIYERFSKLKDSEILFKILYFFTFAKDFLSVDVVAYFLHLEYFRAEFLVGEIREVLWKDPQRDEIDFLQLFHESLRDYLRKKYERERFGIQKIILDGLQGWKDLCEEGIDPRTARYILQYGVTHLLEEGEQKQAEKFVLDPEFVKYQVEYLNFYTVSLDDAVKVLDAIVEELGGKPGTTRPLEEVFKPKLEGEEFRTTTLVRLVNHAGELGHRAGTDIAIAWTWIEEGRVEEAMERLSPIQAKQRLFDCYLFALWLLTLQEDGEANRENLGIVLREIEKNIPSGELEAVKWHEIYSVEFLAEIFKPLIERNQEVRGIYKRGRYEKIKNVILMLLGYNIVEDDEYINSRFDEVRFFITNHCHTFIQIASEIKNLKYSNILISEILETVSLLEDLELERKIFPMMISYSLESENNEFRVKLLIRIGELVSKMNHLELGNLIFPMLLRAIYEIREINYLNMLLINFGGAASKLCDKKLIDVITPIIINYLGEIKYSENCNLLILSNIEMVSNLDNHEIIEKMLPIFFKYSIDIEQIDFQGKIFTKIGKMVSLFSDIELSSNLLQDLLQTVKINEYTLYSYSLLLQIIKTVYILNNKEIGNNLFSNFLEKALKIVHFKVRNYIFICLGELYTELGILDKAKYLFKYVIKELMEIKSLESKFEIIENLCDSTLKLNDYIIRNEIILDIFNHTLKENSIEFQVQILVKIGEVVSKYNDVEMYRLFYPILLKISLEIDDINYQIKILKCLGNSKYENSDIELEEVIFPLINDILRGAKNLRNLDLLICNISEMISKINNKELNNKIFPLLLEFAREINDTKYCSNSIFSIYISILKLNNEEVSNKILSDIIDIGYGFE